MSSLSNLLQNNGKYMKSAVLLMCQYIIRTAKSADVIDTSDAVHSLEHTNNRAYTLLQYNMNLALTVLSETYSIFTALSIYTYNFK